MGNGPMIILTAQMDTMGELVNIYAVARVAFVGKSLLPPGGGHSLLEPIAQGVPVLHGPYIEYQEYALEPPEKQHLTFQVKDAKELENLANRILRNEDSQAPEQGLLWIKKQQGASIEMVDIILNHLKEIDQKSFNA